MFLNDVVFPFLSPQADAWNCCMLQIPLRHMYPVLGRKERGAVLAREMPSSQGWHEQRVPPQLWGRDPLLRGAGLIQSFHKAWQRGSLMPQGRLRAWPSCRGLPDPCTPTPSKGDNGICQPCKCPRAAV